MPSRASRFARRINATLPTRGEPHDGEQVHQQVLCGRYSQTSRPGMSLTYVQTMFRWEW